MKTISDWTMVMGLMENGRFAPEFSEFIRNTLTQLHDQSEEQDGKLIKGSVSLQLNFSIKDSMIEIATVMDAKVPKRPRRVSHFFIVDNGNLSTEHPKQHDMFVRPVSSDRGLSAS